MTQIANTSAQNAALAFRRTVESTATNFLSAMVGEERAKEAAGRLGIALRQLGLTNPKLYECTPESVAQSIAMCALTGLNPGGAYPGCYVIPRNQRVQIGGTWQSVMRMNWQLSWRGMLTLAKRAGWDVRAYPVHKSESFELTYEPEPRIHYRPNPDVAVVDWQDLRGIVVYATNRDRGLTESTWVPLAVIEARRNASEGWHGAEKRRREGKDADSPWHTWPVEMAMKAAIRYAISRGLVPMDDEWQAVEAVDVKADTIDTTAEFVADAQPAALTAPVDTVRAPAGMDALAAALGGDEEPAA